MHFFNFLLGAALAQNASFNIGTISQRLTAGYDTLTRPLAFVSPVPIQAQFRINKLFEVDPKTNSFSMDLFLRLQWKDSRLVFNESLGKEALRVDPSLVWTPDVYFYNEKIKLDVLDQTMKISSDGTVFWSRHFIAQLTTPFQLQAFPYDAQDLKIQLVSYSNNQNTMTLDFYDEKDGGAAFPDPATTFSSVLWGLTGLSGQKSTILFREGQPLFDFLTYTVSVQRVAYPYVYKYILPLFFISFASTMTYWVDPAAVPARVGFGVSLLLSTITLNFVVSSELPKVNYLTRMDIYIAIVFVFVFYALLEFAVIHSLRQRSKNLLSKCTEDVHRFAAPILLLLITIMTFVDTVAIGAATIALIVLGALILLVAGGGGMVHYRRLASAAEAKKNEEES